MQQRMARRAGQRVRAPPRASTTWGGGGSSGTSSSSPTQVMAQPVQGTYVADKCGPSAAGSPVSWVVWTKNRYDVTESACCD